MFVKFMVIDMFSIRNVKVSQNSAQVQHLYESYFLLQKKPAALSQVQMYVFVSLLKHQLTRENTFALIRSFGNEVYEVEKKKLENPKSYAVATFR